MDSLPCRRCQKRRRCVFTERPRRKCESNPRGERAVGIHSRLTPFEPRIPLRFRPRIIRNFEQGELRLGATFAPSFDLNRPNELFASSISPRHSIRTSSLSTRSPPTIQILPVSPCLVEIFPFMILNPRTCSKPRKP